MFTAYYPYSKYYLTPKWQAEVKPAYKAFETANGVVIENLWQLKQALLDLPNEILSQHVGKDFNHFAEWIDKAVWDHDLAKELRGSNQRWGMVVILERHQMRTLNLPPYLAARWLEPTEETFYLANGQYLKSLDELKHSLMSMDDNLFEQHVQFSPNDFANWVLGSIGDNQLAEILSETDNRKKMLIRLSDHLEMLHEAARDY